AAGRDHRTRFAASRLGVCDVNRLRVALHADSDGDVLINVIARSPKGDEAISLNVAGIASLAIARSQRHAQVRFLMTFRKFPIAILLFVFIFSACTPTTTDSNTQTPRPSATPNAEDAKTPTPEASQL